MVSAILTRSGLKPRRLKNKVESQMYEQELLKWPYPVNYGREIEITSDVLVLGGGIAGCWAAISAARKGAKAVIVEKGATIRSGAGGKGCDHWLNTPNPLTDLTSEEITNMQIESDGGYANGLSAYIAARESYDTLLEMEQMGGKIRDTEDEFKDAPFRDEKTKFCFAYDYVNRYQFRVWGTTFKPALYNECKRLGAEIYDRVQITSLLTEGGNQGTRVIGATGLNNRTGEFYIFKAKATINCLSRHQRNWVFSTETVGVPTFRPTCIVGNGHAMCWRAGAQFTMMEKSVRYPAGSGWTYPAFGTGNPFSTWLPCSMVDADGKEIPWEDANGKILPNIEERTRPALGQKFLGERQTDPRWRTPGLIRDLPQRIIKGEFKLPLYANLPSMPDHERRAIFGLMCGEEGRTKIPVVRTYTESGFDPKIDLLQSYMMLGGSPQGDRRPGVGSTMETVSETMLALPQQRAGGESGSAGGLLVDWNLMTTLPGMFAAGDALFAGNYHSHAAATGRYAGRKAADYALKIAKLVIDRRQVEAEKVRVYSPIKLRDGLHWKELTFAGCRVMQNYCGELKNEELLKIGLIWLGDLQKKEVPKLYADNPHKLGRALDVIDILTCDEIIIQASLARKASSKFLSFMRLDYTEVDPAEWHKKWITINLEGEKVKVGESPIDFWGPLKENYEAYNRDYVGIVKE